MPPHPEHQPMSGVWTLRDVERLPEGCRAEVIDGALTINPSPAPVHNRFVRHLAAALESQLPAEWQLESRIDVLLNLEPLDYVAPDLVVFGADVPLTTRPMSVREITLVAEMVAPESRRRDRNMRPVVYADAGIPHFWRVESEAVGAERLTVHVFSEPGDEGYRVEQVFTGRLSTAVPFPIEIDLDGLT
ncbi:Uma2 family endonuclease [Cryptosporangium japonicum]